MVSIYGNAPPGEHHAVLCSAQPEQYPKGERFLIGFVLVNEDGTETLFNDAGDTLFAVSVCNMVTKCTAKAKQFKIRKAMLLPSEYDPIASATRVPDWGVFLDKTPDGRYRVIRIRVEERRTLADRPLSLVTAICRPRDGVWESIEGKFDGPPYRWLRMDGTAKPLSQTERERMPAHENLVYEFWQHNHYQDPRWTGPDKLFIPLAQDDVEALPPTDRAKYEVARIKMLLVG